MQTVRLLLQPPTRASAPPVTSGWHHTAAMSDSPKARRTEASKTSLGQALSTSQDLMTVLHTNAMNTRPCQWHVSSEAESCISCGKTGERNAFQIFLSNCTHPGTHQGQTHLYIADTEHRWGRSPVSGHEKPQDGAGQAYKPPVSHKAGTRGSATALLEHSARRAVWLASAAARRTGICCARSPSLTVSSTRSRTFDLRHAFAPFSITS